MELAKTAYRFLQFSPIDFGTNLWDWSPFFALLSMEHHHADTTLRFYVAESVSILLRISDESKLQLSNSSFNLQQVQAMCQTRFGRAELALLRRAPCLV